MDPDPTGSETHWFNLPLISPSGAAAVAVDGPGAGGRQPGGGGRLPRLPHRPPLLQPRRPHHHHHVGRHPDQTGTGAHFYILRRYSERNDPRSTKDAVFLNNRFFCK